MLFMDRIPFAPDKEIVELPLKRIRTVAGAVIHLFSRHLGDQPIAPSEHFSATTEPEQHPMYNYWHQAEQNALRALEYARHEISKLGNE